MSQTPYPEAGPVSGVVHPEDAGDKLSFPFAYRIDADTLIVPVSSVELCHHIAQDTLCHWRYDEQGRVRGKWINMDGVVSPLRCGTYWHQAETEAVGHRIARAFQCRHIVTEIAEATRIMNVSENIGLSRATHLDLWTDIAEACDLDPEPQIDRPQGRQ